MKDVNTYPLPQSTITQDAMTSNSVAWPAFPIEEVSRLEYNQNRSDQPIPLPNYITNPEAAARRSFGIQLGNEPTPLPHYITNAEATGARSYRIQSGNERQSLRINTDPFYPGWQQAEASYRHEPLLTRGPTRNNKDFIYEFSLECPLVDLRFVEHDEKSGGVEVDVDEVRTLYEELANNNEGNLLGQQIHLNNGSEMAMDGVHADRAMSDEGMGRGRVLSSVVEQEEIEYEQPGIEEDLQERVQVWSWRVAVAEQAAEKGLQ